MSQLQSHNRVAYSGTIFTNDYTDVGAILTFLCYQLVQPGTIQAVLLEDKEEGERLQGWRKTRATETSSRDCVQIYTGWHFS